MNIEYIKKRLEQLDEFLRLININESYMLNNADVQHHIKRWKNEKSQLIRELKLKRILEWKN